jgi:DNA-binding MarR family transcriptional regulator
MTKSKQKSEQRERGAEVAEVADRLHSEAIHLLRRVRRQDSTSGEGPARLSALSVLVFGGPMTLGQLAMAEQVKPPTMTRIVAGLERSGLVRRVGDPADARRIRLHATADGARLLQQARQKRIEYLAHGLEMLGPRDLKLLRGAVGILENLLKVWE